MICSRKWEEKLEDLLKRYLRIEKTERLIDVKFKYKKKGRIKEGNKACLDGKTQEKSD